MSPGDPPRPGRGRPPKKGPSPILIPGEPDSSRSERLADWLRRVVKGARRPEEPIDLNDDEAEISENATDEGDPPHRATIQMLPGRLQPLNPEVVQQEIRFVRVSSGEQAFTLGWEVGDPARHITLDHPSIQPLHARMRYERGSWMIETLAPEDPVKVNDRPVLITDGPYLLADGDRVAIGEAVFRFHLP